MILLLTLTLLQVVLVLMWINGGIPWWLAIAPALLYIVLLVGAVSWGAWETRNDEDFL